MKAVMFRRVGGRIIPIRKGSLGSAVEQTGKRANRFLAKEGTYRKKASMFSAAAKQASESPNPANAAKAKDYLRKSDHFRRRSAQSKSFGMQLGRISEAYSTAGKIKKSAKSAAQSEAARTAGIYAAGGAGFVAGAKMISALTRKPKKKEK